MSAVIRPSGYSLLKRMHELLHSGPNESKHVPQPIVFAFLLCVLQANCLAAQGNPASNSELLARIQESHAKSSGFYDDGHFVWVEKSGSWTDPATGLKHEPEERRFEYWARHGEWSRLDITKYSNGQQIGVVGRSLAVPDQPLRSNWGCTATTCTRPPPHPQDFPVFNAGISVGDTRLSTYISKWLEGSEDVVSLAVDDSDPSKLTFEIVEERLQGRLTYAANVDPNTYLVSSWEREAVTKDGKHTYRQKRHLQYDKEIAGLPRRCFDSDADMDYEISLTSLDRNPAPLSIFDVGIPYPANTETTNYRLAYAVTFGAALTLIFVVYRRFRATSKSSDCPTP
ncbi:hypothetical protein Rcae01_04722 [Novipirellula caenicola]|uniref:Uncharacterized protein n=1 Tax=Novipirellula caenicola TaxID=1536901 RepID=A0ABP9VYD2_9BACT